MNVRICQELMRDEHNVKLNLLSFLGLTASKTNFLDEFGLLVNLLDIGESYEAFPFE